MVTDLDSLDAVAWAEEQKLEYQRLAAQVKREDEEWWAVVKNIPPDPLRAPCFKRLPSRPTPAIIERVRATGHHSQDVAVSMTGLPEVVFDAWLAEGRSVLFPVKWDISKVAKRKRPFAMFALAYQASREEFRQVMAWLRARHARRA